MTATSARCVTCRGESIRATVIIELYRVRCPQCGVRIEKVGQLPSKAPFSKDFEDAVGLACESASVRQVARQFGLAASTVRAIDLRYLQRWNARRRKDRLKQIGVDEIYFGKQTKFITVVSNLETGEPLWFGRDRKQETLDEFFRTQLKGKPEEAHRGGVRGYVAAVRHQHRTMGAQLPHCVRQVPRSAARQQSHR